MEHGGLKAQLASREAAPRAGEVVEFEATLSNSSDVPVEFVQLNVSGPRMGYLLDVSGLPEAKIDHDARTVEASVTVPAHSELRFQLRTLAPRDAAGNTLGMTLHAAHYASSTDLWEHATLTIDRNDPGGGLAVGRLRVTTAGVIVLGWLGAALVVWGLVAWLTRERPAARQGSGVRKRSKPSPARASRMFHGSLPITAALMVPCAFWLVFASMAWRDLRVLYHWREAPAIVLGRRVVEKTSASHSRRSGNSEPQTDTVSTPEFAVQYEVGGQSVISTGYDTGSSLHIGGRVTRQDELAQWQVGTRISCWYDPDQPRDVVVRRGFGGAYVFALLPLPVFWIGMTLLRRGLRQRSPAPDGDGDELGNE